MFTSSRLRPPALGRLLAGLLCAGSLCFQGCSRNGGAPAGDLVLSGNVEVTSAELGFKIPGRVVERLLSEGQDATKGELVAKLDDSEQTAQVGVAQAELSAAQAALAELKAGSRPEEIAAARATLRSAEADRDFARIDFARQEDLRHKNVISARDFELSQAQLRVAQAREAQAAAQARLVEIGPRIETIQQAEAREAQARAALQLARTVLAETRLYSPLTGPVLSHNIEPGEYVSPGTPVLTVADLAHPWVRVYIGETDLGRIRLGEKVVVRSDAIPGKTFTGTIGYISSEAEFTPKTVQTTKERVRLVFRLKVYVKNPDGTFKPGMPADVLIPRAA